MTAETETGTETETAVVEATEEAFSETTTESRAGEGAAAGAAPEAVLLDAPPRTVKILGVARRFSGDQLLVLLLLPRLRRQAVSAT